jgi:hypothetical protein
MIPLFPRVEMDEKTRVKIEEAGRRAIQFRRQGFHCSEASFMAIIETLKIMEPSMVRLVTGFHGGGGSHRLRSGIDLKEVLEGLASGKDRRDPDKAGVSITGHLCGPLASGILCIGYLYGRQSPSDDLLCVDELCFELHRRYMEKLGAKECRALRDKWVPVSSNHTCEYVYKTGSELAVELILEAHTLIPECQKKVFVDCL